MALVEIKALNFSYPGAEKAALSNIDLSVEEGEFVLVAGPSGCGKSTLLRRLKPALSAYGNVSGAVFFGGEPIEALDLRRQSAEIGFVMQDPEMQIATDKVWHELAFGLESLGMPQSAMRVRVAEMANFFGIQRWFHSPVSELSGGQKQLLCLASVMVMQPKLLILDEPTSQLDPIAAADFFDTLHRINSELGTTVIITEHRIEGLFPIADKVVFMQGGRIYHQGSPRDCAELLSADPALSAVLPTAMTVFYETRPDSMKNAPSPLTVREGRSYLKDMLCGEDPSHVSSAKDSVGGKKAVRALQSGSKTKKNDKPVISMREVWYRYEKDAEDILKGASLDINAGELTCMIGGNGAGKTTAIMTASGMFRPYRGKVLLEGKPINKYSDGELFGKRVGVLLQNPILSFTHDSVREELETVVKRNKLEESKLDEIVSLMEIEHILESNPYDISGGELQRAAIAKLLLLEPRILFLDEATKGMDAFFKAKFGELLRKLTARGTAIVLVSHDIEFCAEYADRLAMFFDGGVIAEGTPREVLCGNNFYTTVAARMANGLLSDVVTAKELIEAVKNNP